MSDPCRISLEETTKAILNFFLKSPEVVESFAGIVRWRLMEEEVHRSMTRTEQALHWLIDEGFLLPDTVGSRTVYRLNPARLREAERLVQSGDDPRAGGAST